MAQERVSGPRSCIAKASGTRKAGSRGISVTIYPQPRMKAELVKAAKLAKRPLSNFILHRALLSIAADMKVAIDDLLPNAEYEWLVNRRLSISKKEGKRK